MEWEINERLGDFSGFSEEWVFADREGRGRKMSAVFACIRAVFAAAE